MLDDPSAELLVLDGVEGLVSQKSLKKCLNYIPFSVSSLAEGLKSQPAGLAKDSARSDEFFASRFRKQ